MVALKSHALCQAGGGRPRLDLDSGQSCQRFSTCGFHITHTLAMMAYERASDVARQGSRKPNLEMNATNSAVGREPAMSSQPASQRAAKRARYTTVAS